MKANQKIQLIKNENDEYECESVDDNTFGATNINGIENKIDIPTFFRYDFNEMRDKVFQSLNRKNFLEKEINSENDGKNKLLNDFFKKEVPLVNFSICKMIHLYY
jgi:hypothetical protein